MNEFETVQHLMMIHHISYDDLANRIGQPNGGNLHNALNKNKNIYVSSLRKIINAMDYEIVIRPKNGKGSEYVIDNDNTPSPLRFHDMSLNLESFFSNTKNETSKKAVLTVGERNVKSEALKSKISELSFKECNNELKKIWSIDDSALKGTSSYNQYQTEFNKYQKEFSKLYNTTLPVMEVKYKTAKLSIKKKEEVLNAIPFLTKAHGNIITKDDCIANDVKKGSWEERALEQKKKQSNLLLNLVSEIQLDD